MVFLLRLEKKFVEGSLDMDLALKAFKKLKEEFGKEFHEFELQVTNVYFKIRFCLVNSLYTYFSLKIREVLGNFIYEYLLGEFTLTNLIMIHIEFFDKYHENWF